MSRTACGRTSASRTWRGRRRTWCSKTDTFLEAVQRSEGSKAVTNKRSEAERQEIRRTFPDLAHMEDLLRADRRVRLEEGTEKCYFRVHLAGEVGTNTEVLRVKYGRPTYVAWPEHDVEAAQLRYSVFGSILPPKSEPFDPDGRRRDGKQVREGVSLLDVLDRLQHYLALIDANFASPDEVASGTSYVEGAVRTILVNAYERDPRARQACIAAHGATCGICGFDFGKVYGVDLAGLIHVHHLRPIASVGTAHAVDPVKDMLPVCPNCHVVIHAGGCLREPSEVRRLLGK